MHQRQQKWRKSTWIKSVRYEFKPSIMSNLHALIAYIATNFSAGIPMSVDAQPPYLFIYSETKLKPTQ